MATTFTLKTVRRLPLRGFTFAESMLVLLILTVMMSLTAKTVMPYSDESDAAKVMEGITMAQIEAIRTDDYADYDNDAHDVHVTFNRRGNVLLADSFTVDGKDIIVSLGTGRVYVRP